MTKTEEPLLPNPGEDRFWVIKHQPLKKTMPLRIELRERTVKDSDRNVVGLSRLIGYGESVADKMKVYDEAVKTLIRAGFSDRFVGVWNGEES